MPNRIISSRLAARTGIHQVETLARCDAAADHAEAAVRRVWSELLALLREPLLSPHTIYRRSRHILSNLPQVAAGSIADALGSLARWSHRETADMLTATVPVEYLQAAAVKSQPLREDSSSPSPGIVSIMLTKAGQLLTRNASDPAREPSFRELPKADQIDLYKQLLFPAPPQSVIDRIVYGATSGVSWVDRLTAATRLASPEQLATTISTSYAAGKNVREIAKDLLPVVDGVRSSARRIARTEGMRVAHALSHEAHEALGDMIQGYQVHATLDQYTRPAHAHRSGTIYYRTPAAGQLGFDKMPHPPQEADGSTAHNCRCFLSPVLVPPDYITADPYRMAALGSAARALPDPAVYSEWFSRTDERRRRIAVGSGRYSLVQDLLGHVPSWSNFIDPQSGELVPVDRLKRETPAEREQRRVDVLKLIADRKTLLGQVGTYQFLPPAETAKPKLPDGTLLKFVRHETSPRHEQLIYVDPRKLNAAWRADSGYLPVGAVGPSEVLGRRAGFQRFLQGDKPIQAPRVVMDPDGVAFIDGRHRFAVLRDAGATLVGVMVPATQAALFRQLFASPLRSARSV